MKVRIYTTKRKTHFVKAEEGIAVAMKVTPYASENWAYPVRHFGMPEDKYYAEVWVNGMDWQHNYWIIETHTFEEPKVYPLIIFEAHAQEDKFNQYDFNQLLDAVCWYRRDELWIKEGDSHYGVYGDTMWPYLQITRVICKDENMYEAVFRHASQEPVSFMINKEFVPNMRW